MPNVSTQTLGSLLQDLVGEGHNENAEKNDAAHALTETTAGAPTHAMSLDIAPGVETATSTTVASTVATNNVRSLFAQPWRNTLQFLAGHKPPEEVVTTSVPMTTSETIVTTARPKSLAAQPWKNLLAWLSGNGVLEETITATTTENMTPDNTYTLASFKTKWPSPAVNTPGLNIAGLLEELLISDGENTRS